MFLRRFRDRKNRIEMDLQDALYFIQIALNVVKRYESNDSYVPDADDLCLINEIARTATDTSTLAVKAEDLFHKRNGKELL